MVKTLQVSPMSAIKANITYLGSILQGGKNKSDGIKMLLERKRIEESLEQGQEIVESVIELIAGLDAARKVESRFARIIEKATAVALDIMKTLGAVPLRAEKGKIFDPNVHCVVNTKDVDLPNGTILDVVYRGFKVNGKTYYAEVIVARNSGCTRSREKAEEKVAGVPKKFDWPGHKSQDKSNWTFSLSVTLSHSLMDKERERENIVQLMRKSQMATACSCDLPKKR